MRHILFLAITLFIVLSSCSDNGTSPSSNSDVVRIGNQVWMTKNLDVDTFRNGDTIPQSKTEEDWYFARKNQLPRWCYYNHSTDSGKIYGKLYNWYAVSDSRGLAPEGFHIPSDAEWETLINFLGGEQIAGDKMKSTLRWWNNGNGSNSNGFNGLPGGYCDSYGGFYVIGVYGIWWSFTTNNDNYPLGRYMHCDSTKVGRFYDSEGGGFSVRCIKD